MTWALVTVLLAAAPDTPVRDKLRLGIDFRLWGRDLQLNDRNRLSSGTSVGASPTGVTLDVQWFPAAYFVDDRGADVGISMRVDMAPDFITELPGAPGSRFKGSVTQLRTGMLFRLPFRYAEPAFHAGFHMFEANNSPFASDGTPRPPVPNVSAQGPRLGLSLRLVELWRVTFDVAAGATWLMGLGEIATARFFPRAQGSAFDVKGGLAFRTWKWLDVRLGVDLAVHALRLDPREAVVDMTATDAYYGVSLGIVFKGLP
jgi:hypothetical protein